MMECDNQPKDSVGGGGGHQILGCHEGMAFITTDMPPDPANGSTMVMFVF
jgi:hypothetical protein